MTVKRYYIVKRTRRGWAVFGRKPNDPTVHCLTRADAEKDAAEMNEIHAKLATGTCDEKGRDE